MTKKAFSFEQAIEELQTIVTAMETGNVSLDESLGLDERGSELVRLCNQRLDEAQQRISIVQTALDGTVTTKPFAEEAQS